MSNSKKRWVAWNEVGREVQLAQWREALEAAGGNITAAARTMGFNPRHARRLTKEHELGVFAAELRQRAGNKRVGRPRKTVPRK